MRFRKCPRAIGFTLLAAAPGSAGAYADADELSSFVPDSNGRSSAGYREVLGTFAHIQHISTVGDPLLGAWR